MAAAFPRNRETNTFNLYVGENVMNITEIKCQVNRRRKMMDCDSDGTCLSYAEASTAQPCECGENLADTENQRETVV